MITCCWFLSSQPESAPIQLCSFFPAGMCVTLTGRVCLPLRDSKDRRPNSLSSQVHKKINAALWEPLFPRGRGPEAGPAGGSCLSAGMTSGRGPVTGSTRPTRRSRAVRNIGTMRTQHMNDLIKEQRRPYTCLPRCKAHLCTCETEQEARREHI